MNKIWFVIVLVFGFCVVGCKSKDEKLYAACQKSVKDQLKSPASAKFPPVTEATIGKGEDEGVYILESYVEAKNPLGVDLRIGFKCEVKNNDGDIYALSVAFKRD